MEAMAQQAEAIRAAGPTRPHPWLPDQPPFNILLGIPVAVADRAVGLAKAALMRVVAQRSPS
jgi:hypothetical protein